MAASSSACYYDVFLSFRGEDTRNSFTDHLYTALNRRGIVTFRDDDSAAKGENLKSELEKAIQQSKSSILVLSKDYASSPWCLDELVMILAKKRNSELIIPHHPKHRKHHVLPVFYDVKPSHLRYQKGTVAESFVRYEKQIEEEADYEKRRDLAEKVKRWRSALTEVAGMIGLELQNHNSGSEAKFVDKIIREIEDRLKRKILHVARYEIELESRSTRINRWIQDETSKDSVIGICGMGGIGKTTIAKYVYNHNAVTFDGSSFLADVREVSKQPNGLVSLQTQLLSDISGVEHGKIDNYHQGLAKIENLLRSKRVLLVLDDVENANQIDGVFGILPDWLSPGSKVIITARNVRLLKPCRIFQVHEFDEEESVKLFSLHAFGEDRPVQSYTGLTKRVVRICEGLPLALKVIASSLSGRSEEEWGWELEKLEAIPRSDICSKLKTSFNSLLDDDDKKIFLHIACFFVGEKRDYVIKILEKCNLHAKLGVQNLSDRCLLERGSFKVLKMHRLIQDMGRDLVRQESQDPGERSRLWFHKDTIDVLKNNSGTKKVEGLTFDMRLEGRSLNSSKKRKYEETGGNWQLLKYVSSFPWQSSNSLHVGKDDLTTTAFNSLTNLKLLQLKYVKLNGKYDDFPKGIVWLSWRGFSSHSLPHELALQNLVVLDLRHSKLKRVWKKTPFLESLKILDISYSERLERTPDFFRVPNLEKLILKGCVSLVEVCESIENLEMLELLDLSDCKSLCKLPTNLQKLESLKTINMSGCNITGNPSEMRNMMSLDAVKQVVWSWGTIPRKGLVALWPSLPFSLTELNLSKCNLSDDSFPHTFSDLPSLQILTLNENPFLELPNCIKSLTGLSKLYLMNCSGLQSLDFNGLQAKLSSIQVAACLSLKKLTCPRHVTDALHVHLCPLEETDGYIMRSPSTPAQILLEFGITNYFVGAHKFSSSYEKIEGSEINLEVPASRFAIQYLDLFCNFEYKIKDDVDVYKEQSPLIFINTDLCIIIKNHTKNLQWIYIPSSCLILYEYNKYVYWEWGSRWSFGNQLEAGDIITIHFGSVLNKMKINECRYNLMYQEEGDNSSTDIMKSQHHFPEFMAIPGLYLFSSSLKTPLKESNASL